MIRVFIDLSVAISGTWFVGAPALGSTVYMYCGGGEREIGNEGVDVRMGRRAGAGVGVDVGDG